ncbi:MAG: maleylacetate reductase [Pseudomonadota bacterium]
MENFIYTGLPANVVFGQNTTEQLPEEVEKLNISKAVIFTTPEQAQLGEKLSALLGETSAGIYPHAAMHTPVSVTDKALDFYTQSKADGIIAIGGGSTIGLGKAIALRTDDPQIVLPTSYAGSEMTSIIGQTEGDRKTTQKTLKVLPETVIYDVNYTLTLPPRMTITSGMNAIAHAVEALYAEQRNPILSMNAIEGIRKLTLALRGIAARPDDVETRSDALYGAMLCAICLGSGGVALHHKLCHVLGGSFNLPHAETHTVVLPHALAYNAPAVPDTILDLRRATGEDPSTAFYNIAKNNDVPVSLKELGMPKEGIEKAVHITLENPYFNPRPLEKDGLLDLLHHAWEGTSPTS